LLYHHTDTTDTDKKNNIPKNRDYILLEILDMVGMYVERAASEGQRDLCMVMEWYGTSQKPFCGHRF